MYGIRPLDREALRAQFTTAQPFPFMAIDDFLEPDFLAEVVASYPDFDSAWNSAGDGARRFNALNEQKKIQLTDAARFPDPVRKLNESLASPEFLGALEDICQIPRLLADPLLHGGGMHLTGPGGRLDVHVDFNYVADRELHRRLNILIYLNPEWEESWGGQVELWDRDVKTCHHAFLPVANRCVVFQTNEVSYHGVQPVKCPPHVARRSFAAYYYTKEAPPNWDGRSHSTLFRARPNEVLRGNVLMPLRDYQDSVKRTFGSAKRALRRALRMP